VLNGGVKQRFLATARGINSPVPFDLAGFCSRLQSQRDRIIRRVHGPVMPVAVPGLRVSKAESGYSYHEERTRHLYRTRIVLRAIAHMPLRHRGGARTREDTARLPASGLSRGLMRLMPRRSACGSVQEPGDEVLASMIRQDAARAMEPLPGTEPEIAGWAGGAAARAGAGA